MSCGCGGGTPANYSPIGERIWRALNLRGSQGTPGIVPPTLAAEITALDLTQPEYAWLARIKRYIGGGVTAAVAAQNTQWEVRNNAGSGVLTIIDEITVQSGTTTDVGLFMSTTVNLTLAQAIRVQALDSRQEEAGILSTPSPQTLLFTGASVLAIPPNALAWNLIANTEKTIKGPWVLKPGTYLRFVVGTVNVGSYFRCTFRERQPTPSEL